MLQKKKGNVTSQNLGHCSHEMWRFTSGITRGVLENSPFSSMVFSINQYVRMCLPYFPIILPLKKNISVPSSSIAFHPAPASDRATPPRSPRERSFQRALASKNQPFLKSGFRRVTRNASSCNGCETPLALESYGHANLERF